MPEFVVHKHHARRLHYDLRLEMDNVLKSWAIPKEPPLEKGVKRLAIQVEDHSLEYIDFEGEIPEGHYGAGKVEIWDRGNYEMLKKTDGEIKVKFEGMKLMGEYILLRFEKSGENNWLFFKKQ